jgi:hypothetical protein
MSESTPIYRATLHPSDKCATMSPERRAELEKLRRQLIGALRVVEDELGLPQSIARRKR